MPKLVLLQGASGTGKTSIAHYLKDSYGFNHLELDSVLEKLRDVYGSTGEYRLDARPVILAFALADRDRIFWAKFWEARKEKQYTLETARKLLGANIEEINSGEVLSQTDRFHLWSAVWDAYLSERDVLLLKDQDVVLDSITNPDTRLNNLRLDGLPESLKIEKYIIRLQGDIEKNVARKAKQLGWPPERIERKVSQNVDLTDLKNLKEIPDAKISPIYDNREDGAIEKIKQEIRVLLWL